MSGLLYALHYFFQNMTYSDSPEAAVQLLQLLQLLQLSELVAAEPTTAPDYRASARNIFIAVLPDAYTYDALFKLY